MNQVIITGNLGSAPEPRETKSGIALTNLSVASNERAKDPTTGDWQDHTEWHKVTVFGKQAELCNQYLAKGSKVLVLGKLRTREFTDKEGIKRKRTEIIADSVEFLSRANANTSPSPSYQQPAAPVPSGSMYNDDEIPF